MGYKCKKILKKYATENINQQPTKQNFKLFFPHLQKGKVNLPITNRWPMTKHFFLGHFGFLLSGLNGHGYAKSCFKTHFELEGQRENVLRFETL